MVYSARRIITLKEAAMKPGTRGVAIALLLLTTVAARAADEKPDPRLGSVKSVFIEKASQDEANDRVSACMPEKLKDHGPLTVAASRDKADAVLALDATIPNLVKRNSLMKKGAAKATFTVSTPAGVTLWKAENMFKKGSAVWGGKLDAACGLANGIAKQLSEAVEKAGNPKR
jgi:hypothetical protein